MTNYCPLTSFKNDLSSKIPDKDICEGLQLELLKDKVHAIDAQLDAGETSEIREGVDVNIIKVSSMSGSGIPGILTWLIEDQKFTRYISESSDGCNDVDCICSENSRTAKSSPWKRFFKRGKVNVVS